MLWEEEVWVAILTTMHRILCTNLTTTLTTLLLRNHLFHLEIMETRLMAEEGNF